MVNAENAGLKAPRFSKPNEKARRAMFESVLEDLAASKGDKGSDGNLKSKITTNLLKNSGSGSLNDLTVLRGADSAPKKSFLSKKGRESALFSSSPDLNPHSKSRSKPKIRSENSDY